MKYKLWLDEKNEVVRISLFHSLTKEEAEQMVSETRKLIIESNTRKGIIDLSQADNSRIAKESRQVYRKYFDTFPLDKVAVIVNSPIIRMIAKVALSSLGKIGVARFFTTEIQAISWLNEK